MSLFPDFKNGDKNVKTFLKYEQIWAKEKFENFTISNSNKMQLLLNASKAWRTIPAASSKKQEPS